MYPVHLSFYHLVTPVIFLRKRVPHENYLFGTSLALCFMLTTEQTDMNGRMVRRRDDKKRYNAKSYMGQEVVESLDYQHLEGRGHINDCCFCLFSQLCLLYFFFLISVAKLLFIFSMLFSSCHTVWDLLLISSRESFCLSPYANYSYQKWSSGTVFTGPHLWVCGRTHP